VTTTHGTGVWEGTTTKERAEIRKMAGTEE
jgi:hypothetical protein